MTAFLFIPSSIGTPVSRRVDLSNIAGLFGEIDEPFPVPAPGRRAILSTVLAVLIAVGVIGDLMLVATPDRVAAQVASPQTILTLERAATRPDRRVFSSASAI